uniref:Plectin/eS10 N-terminal domain-containing protein n=1 Tax=Arcella intermedia TaxID=1963864 RepID=A0A6B2LPJ6_9EUKA|eukprot:TRINITY_DN7135_c0_g1_i1.p1 TRINITY_DN7135_c0_g1~~TRINITY_DN7135_c0_g1_i1.p1  ORF type:complete len:154 (-),score=34.60 TRINITY_DN7135_c0_g1_i1:108-569(-)
MLIPKKDRVAIYQQLFKDGVLVSKKDLRIQHPEIKVSNLYVINLMRSLKSRSFVVEKFCWNHYYWYLTNEGIQYLRDYLHIPDTIIPATLKKAAPRAAGPRTGAPRGGRFQKEGAPSGDFQPSFGEQGQQPSQPRGGYYARPTGLGRGQPAQQ